jgi:hypothetical protein
MQDEDTKEMAEAGSFGLRIEFEARRDLRASELTKLIGDYVIAVVDRVANLRPFIGHAKAFIKTPIGHIQVNLVDSELGTEIVQTIDSGPITSGTANFMAVAVGVKDAEIEKAMRQALEPVALKLKITILEHDHSRITDRLISLGDGI